MCKNNCETTFENAKVGDKVWCFLYGFGSVCEVNLAYYRITVEFCDIGKLHYDTKGRISGCGSQVLFWDEVKFEVPCKKKPAPPVDTVVMVFQSKLGKYIKRHSAGAFGGDGGLLCYYDGRSSKTIVGENDVAEWEDWYVAETEDD